MADDDSVKKSKYPKPRQFRSGTVGAVSRITAGMQKMQRQRAARPHYEQGWSLAMAGEFEGALVAFDRAIQHDPTYTEAYLARGHARYALYHLNDALADYEAYVRLAGKTASESAHEKIKEIRDKLNS